MKGCPKCGCETYYDIKHEDGETHYGKRVCADCGRWLKWIVNPTDNAKLKKFLEPTYGGDYKFVFGKHFNKYLSDMIIEERSYLVWMSKSDFPEEVHTIINGVLEDGIQFIGDLQAEMMK